LHINTTTTAPTLGTQDDEKQNKNNTICVGHHYAQQAQIL